MDSAQNRVDETLAALEKVHKHGKHVLGTKKAHVLPDAEAIAAASEAIFKTLPNQGIGLDAVVAHLCSISTSFNAPSLSPNYYGFVTGGVTPAARVADHLVSLHDQNLFVHLPEQSSATLLEHRALSLLADLLDIDNKTLTARTFTTGATASNILGLATGRDWVLLQKLRRKGYNKKPSELGLIEAASAAGVKRFQVLTTLGHSSLSKAAKVVGIGSHSVINIGKRHAPLEFDFDVLETRLRDESCASIVVVSCGEVNTGGFATHLFKEMMQLRFLCDEYGAWIHMDGAFGIFARAIGSGAEFERIRSGCDCVELVDSLTGDLHKMLNVPYDCGFFFCNHPHALTAAVSNPNAAYLVTPDVPGEEFVPSPLNLGLENSRRFRALPVYATLLAYGREGYVDMLKRQVRLARRMASWIRSSEQFELLPVGVVDEDVYVVVLFRALDGHLNDELVKRINSSRRMYVSGTAWEGRTACRVAVATWMAEPERDFALFVSILESILEEFTAPQKT